MGRATRYAIKANAHKATLVEMSSKYAGRENLSEEEVERCRQAVHFFESQKGDREMTGYAALRAAYDLGLVNKVVKYTKD